MSISTDENSRDDQIAAQDRYREALELILELYHSRLPEDLPSLPFQMKEVALRALAEEEAVSRV